MRSRQRDWRAQIRAISPDSILRAVSRDFAPEYLTHHLHATPLAD
jgi:hypothetical protein